MSANIVLVDYGMGNLHSVKKKLLRLNENPIITSSKEEILNADKVILVGVGNFKKAMLNLNQLNIVDALNEIALVKKKPVLGICLGMQLMANKSEEGGVDGLGWVDGNVVKITVSDRTKYKVPHMGWNSINKIKDSPLMEGIPNKSEFYFIHSYYFKPNHSDCILNETEYAFTFVSAFQQENIYGVQYHPEKSHDNGNMVLSNFLRI